MDSSSEKFCLQWNEFSDNMKTSFKEIRAEEDFFDVSLVTEDNQTIDAHKVVLAACSSFFKDILRRSKHPHPLIYLKGVKSSNLGSVMNYVYNGEVNVYQDQLDEFLETAQELKLKGLSGDVNKKENNSMQEGKKQFLKEHQYERLTKTLENSFDDSKLPTQTVDDYFPMNENQKSVDRYVKPLTNRLDNSKNYPELEDDYAPIVEERIELLSRSLVMNAQVEDHVKEKMNSMMEQLGNGLWSCNQCGKTSKKRRDLGRHVETHIEGVTYPCSSCGKPYRSKRALDLHFSQQHE